MIVDPDFLDHWKTRSFVGLLGNDELAPLCIIRLWSHCQVRKTHRFSRLSAEALAGICRFKGDPSQLWLAIQTSGFARVKNEVFIVHDWEKHNKSLVNSWKNGRYGGRPKKPTGSPTAQPAANPRGPREEKRREEKIVCVRARAREADTHTHQDLRLAENHAADLASKFPAHDIPACIRRAKDYVRKKRGSDSRVTVAWFVEHWMPNEPEASISRPSAAPKIDAPAPPTAAEVDAFRQHWLAQPEPADANSFEHALWLEARQGAA